MDKIIKLIKNNKTIVFLLSLFLILVIVLTVVINLVSNDNNINNNNNKEYTFGLFGSSEITINEGEEYIEPGFYAYYGNLDVFDQVIVSGSVDSNKEGIYVITYRIGDKVLTRKVQVLEKELENEEIDIKFELIGDTEISLKLNESYQELGFIAKDLKGNDLSQYVEINNQVNTSLEGIYYITYILNYNNQKYELKRKVIVIESLDLNISYDNISYQKEITLKINASGSNLKYLLLPNKVITKELNTTYKITKNGTYTFYLYDNDDKYIEKSVVISNIDNNIDSASCNLLVKVKSSEIVIQASDSKSGIKSYKYNGIVYKNNKINVDSKLKSANVIVYDNAGNSKNINCSIDVVEQIYGFILIGDSRFVGMKNYLGENIRPNDTIIAKGSMGYSWFVNTAIGEVNKILKNNPDKKYYIMSNLGVNGLSSGYASKLSSLSRTDWKEHIVGYISVNPYADNNPNSSNNKKIDKFNQEQKSQLDGVYYCDTYNGIGVLNFKKSGSSGLHYNKSTSILVYEYIINNCAF